MSNMLTAVVKFSSERERRLWLWTMAAVVAIYSTLGLSRTFAVELRNRGLVDAAFLWAFVVILLAIAALALKIRPGGKEVGVWLGVAAAYSFVFIRMALPEERTHVVEYGVVAILVHEALVERASNGRGVTNPALLALGLTILIGSLDEFLQLLIPSRVFDPADMFVNSVSAFMALLAKLALGTRPPSTPQRCVSPIGADSAPDATMDVVVDRHRLVALRVRLAGEHEAGLQLIGRKGIVLVENYVARHHDGLASGAHPRPCRRRALRAAPPWRSREATGHWDRRGPPRCVRPV